MMKKLFKPKEDLPVEFREEGIIFPKGYYFRQSPVKANVPIPPKSITEINSNTYPPSFVRKDIEVIFIPHQYKDQLEKLGQTHQILQVDRFDIWAAINEPFLDTVFDSIHQEQTMVELERNGVSPAEVKRIRKRIRFLMLFSNAYAWEWVHLGQFDYLNWTFLTRNKYAWSMEIALRNKGRN